MSGHWRFCVAAFVLVGGLSTSPAISNPFTDLFNPAPQEAATPAPAPAPASAPAKEQCLPQPGRSTAPGQHWVYHLDGHSKCWYQADAATIAAKRQAHNRAARQPAIASGEDEAELRKKPVADARAQLLSTASADAFPTTQTTPPAPESADPVPANAAPPPVPAPPVVAAAPVTSEPAIDQSAPDQTAPHPVDVEMMLAAAAPVGTAVASAVPPPAPGVPSVPNADAGHWEAMTTRAGLALIALGLAFLIGSLLASRFRDQEAAATRRA